MTEHGTDRPSTPRFPDYSGTGGIREVLVLAGPLVASSLSWSIMNFIDRVFLMGYSEAAVAAALPSGAIFFTLICPGLGIASYVTTFVSQYFGAGRPHRIGASVWQGIWLSLIASPFILLTIPLAHGWFAIAGHPSDVADLETIYYQISCTAAPALMGAAALSGFFTGRGKSNVVMVVDCLGAALNVVLDYAWIFGHWGLPAWGVAGAAWATVASLWFKLILYFLLFVHPSNNHAFHIWSGMRWDRPLMYRLLRFGGPNGIQMFIEVAAFSIFLLLIGQLGTHELAASSLAFNVNSLAFMPAWGVSLATTTLVGQYLGRNEPDTAAHATWSALMITTVYMIAISACYLFVPDAMMAAHWAAGDVSTDDQLRQVLPTLLMFVASYCLFDGMNIIFAGALKGAGDTPFIMFTNLALGISVVTLTWLGISRFGLGLYGAWSVLTGWVLALGVIFLGRFLQGKWRHMRVIEEKSD